VHTGRGHRDWVRAYLRRDPLRRCCWPTRPPSSSPGHRQVCGADATVARLGGDEFAVLLPNAGAEQARTVESAVRSCFDWAFPLTTGPIRAAGSIGYAVGTPGDSLDEVLAAADAAMYHRKRYRVLAGVPVAAQPL
jgi:predicted signal transduction protein with EAL and GGDEF domain